MIIKILAIVGLVILVILLVTFMPLMYGAPFEPTSKKELKNIIKIARVKRREKVAELGSGNGKVVIALAKQCREVHGYEINPFLVLYSRRRIKKFGIKNAYIHWKNFWNQDTGKFDVIILFQVSYVMKKIRDKIKKECKKPVRVVSNTWKFPGMKPLKKISHIKLYKFTPTKHL